MEKFEKGTKVFIKPGSNFYDRKSDSNPRNVVGLIISIKGGDYCYRVRWNNGFENNYSTIDLSIYEGNFVDSYSGMNLNKIYFKDKKPKNLKNILNTLYSSQYGSTIKTYHKNNKEYFIQCEDGKMRSFDDYFLICKTYFPKVKIETAFKNLLLFKMNLLKVEKNLEGLRLRACSTIDRINISTSEVTLVHNYTNSLLSSKYGSIYSWEELFKMININSVDDLIQFYKTNLKE